MGKTLFMECTSGISGDMTVAALLDLGADRQVLERVLDSIPVQGFEIAISRVKKSGLDCMDFSVVLDATYENHDHDMEYLHGHEHPERHEHREAHHEHHKHQENYEHHHENREHHHEHKGVHEHRRLSDVLEIIQKTKMTEGAKRIAEKIFTILAKAEAKAHGMDVNEVHFHEVGAVDSIADVIAAAVCFDNLGIEEVIVPGICEGRGTVRCAHGILPIPVPAVANIMEAYHLPVEFMDIHGEFVTPTGAAIVAAMMTSDRLENKVKIVKTGIGAGKRSYERPSLLRMMLVERLSGGKEDAGASNRGETSTGDRIYKLETNLDDCTGEALGFVMESLFQAGARDVHYTPVYMKKNRPGWQLNVICEKKDIEKLEQIIFRETTTIGIRKIPYERDILPRRTEKVETSYGEALVKVCEISGKKRAYPEYDSVAKISREKGVSFQEVYMEIMKAWD